MNRIANFVNTGSIFNLPWYVGWCNIHCSRWRIVPDREVFDGWIVFGDERGD